MLIGAKMNTPRPIGYWHYEHGGQDVLPHPGDLVRPDWISADERNRLVSYLRNGATYETWRGLSFCRFGCGIDCSAMGCRDLTDGVWVWPEGLHHYVDRHKVMLPEDFVSHCRTQSWTIPPDAIGRIKSSRDLDFSMWIAWAKEVRKLAEPKDPANPSQRTHPGTNRVSSASDFRR